MPYIGEPFDATHYAGDRPEGYTKYAAINKVQWSAISDDIEERVGRVSGKQVLEIGCAFGFLVNELASRNASIQGVDISAFAIAEAQARFPKLNFIQADAAQSLPFSDDTFHLAIAIGVTECMPDEATLNLLLNELNRILYSSKGKIYILGQTEPGCGYFVKTQEYWNKKVIGDRTVISDSVGHFLPYDTRMEIN